MSRRSRSPWTDHEAFGFLGQEPPGGQSAGCAGLPFRELPRAARDHRTFTAGVHP